MRAVLKIPFCLCSPKTSKRPTKTWPTNGERDAPKRIIFVLPSKNLKDIGSISKKVPRKSSYHGSALFRRRAQLLGRMLCLKGYFFVLLSENLKKSPKSPKRSEETPFSCQETPFSYQETPFSYQGTSFSYHGSALCRRRAQLLGCGAEKMGEPTRFPHHLVQMVRW